MVRAASVRAQRQRVSERMAARETHSVAYADGSCIGNPGPGGWGVLILEPDGSERELSGGNASTTNNRMELTAVVGEVGAPTPRGAATHPRRHSYGGKTVAVRLERAEEPTLLHDSA